MPIRQPTNDAELLAKLKQETLSYPAASSAHRDLMFFRIAKALERIARALEHAKSKN